MVVLGSLEQWWGAQEVASKGSPRTSSSSWSPSSFGKTTPTAPWGGGGGVLGTRVALTDVEAEYTWWGQSLFENNLSAKLMQLITITMITCPM